MEVMAEHLQWTNSSNVVCCPPWVVPANTTFLQHVSSINTNGCYKSLLLTLFFCFRTGTLYLNIFAL